MRETHRKSAKPVEPARNAVGAGAPAVFHADAAGAATQARAEGAVLTKAVMRAAERLGLSRTDLTEVLGVSAATLSRMGAGTYHLSPGEKPFELAALFVRLYRSLDAVTGGDGEVAVQWLRNENTALGARPGELLKTIAGLVQVLAYLDARRAIV